MKLKLRYMKKEEIPAGYEALYTLIGEEWVLTGIDGMKSDEDITRLQGALNKEREDHKTAKAALAAYKGVTAEQVATMLDEMEVLKAGAAKTPEEIEKLVEARVKIQTAPLQRKLDEALSQNSEKDKTIEAYVTKEKTSKISKAVLSAAKAAKVVDTALEDVEIIGAGLFTITDDGKVIGREGTALEGLPPEVWLKDQLKGKPHWFGESIGTGAHPGNGNGHSGANPFTHENWNLTAQGQLLRSDRALAERLAQMAGTTIGGARPQPKK